MAKGRKTGGRAKGVPNKTTTDVRAAIALIARRNIDNVESWLGEIEDPAKRVGLFLDLCEYHIPKLQRTDINANITAKTEQLVRISFVPGKVDAA